MDSSLFDYDLPTERIAQQPAERRDGSRLLVVDRANQSLEHRHFSDLPDYLGERDILFRNAAKVLPARLFGRRSTGGQMECLLLRPAEERDLSSKFEDWWCLLRPGKRLNPGSRFTIEGHCSAEVVDKNQQAEYLVRFEMERYANVRELAESAGVMPLPPYISRQKDQPASSSDRERYQTVYADSQKMVAAAAPTAGLHFTEELNERLASKGTKTESVILHVGMGTFKPLEAKNIEDHEIHREIYEIPFATQKALRAAPGNGQRRVCVGTTSVRSIEDYLRNSSVSSEGVFMREADLYLYPPTRFMGTDALITNFHLPKSTLLCLVSSFLTPGETDGIAWLKEIYAEAIRLEYRFLSYGDAMLIL